ncbi:hypothetical protein AMATHDRAFT_5759 [Amanita thiersii Skay4041]|uniref:Uncharacterized protein n=1 Tax=Amanita thiersii Skay4041 TaxID=703135 RepID=A0A2A9NEM4_9AGAR|nr:hypothetical protein AMATHDRAFT_5759 [Amanita thiersii Skay4041]
MGIFFPDNDDRGKRAEQLASDIEHLQSQIKEDVEASKKHDEKTIEYLEKVLKARGFKTLNDLIAEGEGKLSKEDREKYSQMKDAVQNLDDGVTLALNVGSGIAGLGAISELSAQSLSLLLNHQLVMIGYRMMAIGFVKLISGEAAAGFKILKAAGGVFSKILKGEGLAGKAATTFRVLKIAGKVLAIVGIVIDIATLAWDAIEESKKRTQLQNAIKELCVSRLQVNKVQEYTRASLFFSSDAKSTADIAVDYEEDVKDGSMTRAKANEKLNKKIDKWIPELKKEIDKITEKSAYDDLTKFDTDRSSWSNEDPDFKNITDKLKDVKDSEESKEGSA